MTGDLRRKIAGLTAEQFEKRAERPLAIVAVIFLVAYSVQVLAQPQGRVAVAIDLVIAITYAVFLVDYLARLILAINRPRWFVRHLVDLAIIALPLLRPLRLLRLLVLLAALQKTIGGAIRGRVAIYTASGAVLLIYAASLAVLESERGQPGSMINNFGDAVWWSITTVTTVGYGDILPVTGTGRVVAVLLMMGGISLVGVVTATLASWIVQRVAQEDTKDRAATAGQIEAVHEEFRLQMKNLREEVQKLREAASPQPPAPRSPNGQSVDAATSIRNWIEGSLVRLQAMTLLGRANQRDRK
ncbi:potassium channel family protein [Mycobacterium sp. ITM-2016-00318]|uniref:potassium channel family protein n=1 Tax=Mycobacterium sp. ITM-2016-00318 TaxID=2099693 RepID=UPI000CF9F31E|nr:potassium channel family protein [Mycobacterium sp. ITM-2016-00318]WNG95342.1 potassium channel family protein [Mycobacterium sp. ITM-2016-00318]